MTQLAEVGSIGAFADCISSRYFAESRGRWVFRGHSNASYTLVPSVGRGAYSSPTREKHERSLFDIFQREALTFLPSRPKDDWEWLSLAQHHGLPTRFLDWTHNPLVALYFCVEANPEKDGEVFALQAFTKASEAVREASPFALTVPVKYYPTVVTPRLRAQEGLFVACAALETPLDQVLRVDWKIDRISIRAERKPHLRYELFRMGIHASSLFPDIDGLAARLRWQHSITSPLAGLRAATVSSDTGN